MDDLDTYSYSEYDFYEMFANDTIDYKNVPFFGHIKKVPLYEIIFKSYLYAMIIFFSLVGNTLIIVVVMRHKQMRTTTNFYIVNLAVADILVTVFCTWVHLVNNLNNNTWVLGGFFCKFNTFSQVLCLVASVLSLTLIAYDRFFGIVFALKAHMTSRKARFSICIIWLCSFAIAAPLLWFRKLNERQWQNYTERWCDDSWPRETKAVAGTNTTMEYMPSRTIYFTFVSAVLYFFPMIVMTIAYSVIIRKLRSSTIPGERVTAGYEAQQKTKRKVIAMLVTIMAVFGICWLPYQIVLLYSELRETRDTLGDWYFTMQFLAGCFAYSNSALNPLIYAGFNKNFKQGIRGVWQAVRCHRNPAVMDPKTYGTYNSSTYATAL
ncbi:substance-P receptor-like [Ruditapes philippinarum]|uniref:substance-P receptor-like n=1 Tax=Ruditapes philippinarum TaxID=129788 RepID=UPI00295BBEB4|nr:substance-P receptor-like [Ruditapes philippinarum]